MVVGDLRGNVFSLRSCTFCTVKCKDVRAVVSGDIYLVLV